MSLDDWPAPGDLVRVSSALASIAPTIQIRLGMWTWCPAPTPHGVIGRGAFAIVVAVTSEKYQHATFWRACYVVSSTTIGWIGEDSIDDSRAHKPFLEPG